jgi:hypothetical protein
LRVGQGLLAVQEATLYAGDLHDVGGIEALLVEFGVVEVCARAQGLGREVLGTWSMLRRRWSYRAETYC